MKSPPSDQGRKIRRETNYSPGITLEGVRSVWILLAQFALFLRFNRGKKKETQKCSFSLDSLSLPCRISIDNCASFLRSSIRKSACALDETRRNIEIPRGYGQVIWNCYTAISFRDRRRLALTGSAQAFDHGSLCLSRRACAWSNPEIRLERACV